MAADNNSADVDSGIASTEVTPVNQEGSSLEIMEEVTTPAVASSERDASMERIISHLYSTTTGSVTNADISAADEDDDTSEDIDESLAERLFGLTEMFPESLRNATAKVVSTSGKLIAGGYNLGRQVVWVFATTSLLLFAPVLFEVERLNAEEMIKQDRNKLVLGPGTAMSGGPSGPGGLMPPPPPTH